MTPEQYALQHREAVDGALAAASRRRLEAALGTAAPDDDVDQAWAGTTRELELFDLIASDAPEDHVRRAALEAFQIQRVRQPPAGQARLEWWTRLACLGVLSDRAADFRRLAKTLDLTLSDMPTSWGPRVRTTLLELWLRLVRKDGWTDLDAVQTGIVRLRQEQSTYEPPFLEMAEARRDATPAWELMASYHLAKAAELLAVFLTQGSVEGRFDIRQQLEAQFDRAISAAARSGDMELEPLARILERTSEVLVAGSIWTVTRAVNSRVTRFVTSLTARHQSRPLLEMLPPQRRALREEGLLGSGHRAVVVSLPTSSGKTLIAQFRILQALNQFDGERGWVAYLAPTRALVNQITVRLRRDFAPLGVSVEKVSPALEVDGAEDRLLCDADQESQFRVLVATPEKLDLMLRGGWEKKIGRPLTLVVVDEAQGLAEPTRGLRLELLLATINRECRYAQFLLLTPFVPNANEVAKWLSPDSHDDIGVGLDWTPNDRAVVLVRARPKSEKHAYDLEFEALHTTRKTLETSAMQTIAPHEALKFTRAEVKTLWKLGAATTQALSRRGTVIALADKKASTWKLVDALKLESNRIVAPSSEIRDVQTFIRSELGADFPLVELLDHGLAVHHAGLSDDVRTLVEVLAERDELRVLAATTTLAQGVNFPVSAVVLTSHLYPYGVPMPTDAFWNMAGRAGRVDQGDLGIVALVADDDARADTLRKYAAEKTTELTSSLVKMVSDLQDLGQLLSLERLSYEPAWSGFVQFLAHTYRHLNDHERFVNEVEPILRGTFGFGELRRRSPHAASALIRGVRQYAARLSRAQLGLVDSTGFSPESVGNTLARLKEAGLGSDVWSPELFGSRREDLRRLMGVLLEVPELRENLEKVRGGKERDGDLLARIVSDWVRGRALPDLAKDYFGTKNNKPQSSVEAMTECCSSVFGQLTQTASWGLAALQAMTLDERFDKLPGTQQRELRNLPARVYYGVNSEAAVSLRLLNVPRSAAEPVAKLLGVRGDEPASQLRARLRQSDDALWTRAIGSTGATFRRVWRLIDG